MPANRLIHRHAALDAALKRLAGALHLLEAATERLERAESERRDGEEVLAAMEEDRGRLAADLGAASRGRMVLAEAVEDVAERLRSAGGVLRDLIEARQETVLDEAAAGEGREP